MVIQSDPDPAVWERRGRFWYKLGGSNPYAFRVCEVCGTESLMCRSQKLCSQHCRTVAQTGKRRGVFTYFGAHARVKRERGPASQHICPCGLQAREWSYDGSDPNEMVENRLRFSADPEHYRALCSRCHRQADMGGERNPQANVPDSLVEIVVAEYRAGGITQTELAVRHGVSQSAVSTWVRGTRRCAE